MTENKIESEEYLFDLGFEERQYTFYQPRKDPTFGIVTDPNFIYEGVLLLDKTVVSHERSIYTFWDFLGDIGGLFSILQQLASPVLLLVSLVTGSGLQNFLIESIFRVQKGFDGSKGMTDYILRRKPLKA